MGATRAFAITAWRQSRAALGSLPPAGPSFPSRIPSSLRCVRLRRFFADCFPCRAIRPRARHSAKRLTDELPQSLPIKWFLEAQVGDAVQEFLRAGRESAAGHEDDAL